MVFGKTTSGKQTAATGRQIQVVGPVKEPDWREALPVIMGKLQGGGCDRLAFVPWDAESLAASRAPPRPFGSSEDE